jgi:hypothetical protein
MIIIIVVLPDVRRTCTVFDGAAVQEFTLLYISCMVSHSRSPETELILVFMEHSFIAGCLSRPKPISGLSRLM